MGRGGAQLGKAVKGKSKEKKKEKKALSKLKENYGEKSLTDDIKLLEEYEKLNSLAEGQKIRLKKLSQSESFNNRLNKKILNQIYRTLLRNEKLNNLKGEIEILSQNHSRDYDRKDSIIEILVRDLENSEEQFSILQRNHAEFLRKLWEIFYLKSEKIVYSFDQSIKQLKNEYYSEKNAITASHSREIKEITSIITSIENEENEKNSDYKQYHETEREEIRNKNLELINELRINLENKIEDLERQFDDSHQSYVENTENANEEFKKLKADDAILSQHIFEKKKKIIKYQNLLSMWKKKLEYNYRECSKRNNDLKEQKEKMNKHCNALKERMKKFRQAESKKLMELTTLSREAILKNQLKLNQAEKILMCAELARKYETEKEKITPFYENTLAIKNDGSILLKKNPIYQTEAMENFLTQTMKVDTGGLGGNNNNTDNINNNGKNEEKIGNNNTTMINNNLDATLLDPMMNNNTTNKQYSSSAPIPSPSSLPLLESSSTTSSINASTMILPAPPSSHSGPLAISYNDDGEAVGEWGHLENYFKKYNKILLDVLAIRQEKKRLEKENTDLRNILKQYLDGIAITENAVDHDNPLLIVNGKINFVDHHQAATQKRLGRPNVTMEASQVVSNYAVHGARL